MRRPGPSVPVAFYVGLALLSASLVELSRWPLLSIRINGANIGGSRGPFPWADHPDSWWLRVSAIVLAVAGVLAASWLVAQRGQTRRPAQAAALALAMPCIALGYGWLEANVIPGCINIAPSDLDATLRDHDLSHLPALGMIALVCAFGVALSMRRPLFCSRAVSAATLGFGLLTTLPAIAVARDSTIELSHQRYSRPDGIEPAPVSHCLEPRGGSVFTWSPATGAAIGDETGAEWPGVVGRYLNDQHQKSVDLHSATGDPPPPPPVLIVAADQRMTLWVLNTALGEASAWSEVVVVQIASWRRAGTLWTMGGGDERLCITTVKLTDSGRPIDSFKSWPELVHAADDSQGMLELRPTGLRDRGGDFLMEPPATADPDEFENW